MRTKPPNETKILDLGNGAVGITLGILAVRTLRLAPGDAVLVTIQNGGLRIVKRQETVPLDPEINCSNLWEHAAKMWASTGLRRSETATDVTNRQLHRQSS